MIYAFYHFIQVDNVYLFLIKFEIPRARGRQRVLWLYYEHISNGTINCR